MALRFRRSIKIAPGIRLNFGTKGVSVSAGVRGASVTVGPRGTYGNVGLPGTGISYRTRLDSKTQAHKSELVRQQRFERQQLKIEQEKKRQEALSKVKLSLDKVTGAVRVENAHGEELSPKDLKLVWEQKAASIADWLEREADDINGDVALLANIHHDTPPLDSEPQYELDAYPMFAASPPSPPSIPPRPVPTQLPPLNIFLGLFRNKRERHVLRQKELDDEHVKNLAKWLQSERQAHDAHQLQVKGYEKDLSQWRSEKQEHLKKQLAYKAAFPTLIRSDLDTMERLLENELQSLIWPRETLFSYQIANGAEVWLDVDLPEIEDLPQKVATIHSSGKKLVIKEKPRKQLQLEYAAHIFGVAFRLAGTSFATLPGMELVVISGFSQRPSTAMGSISDEYLYSVKIDRAGFSKVNFDALDQVDPIEAMRTFDCRVKLSATGIFKNIEPFIPS